MRKTLFFIIDPAKSDCPLKWSLSWSICIVAGQKQELTARGGAFASCKPATGKSPTLAKLFSADPFIHKSSHTRGWAILYLMHILDAAIHSHG